MSGAPLATLAHLQGRVLQLGNSASALALEDGVALRPEPTGQLPADVEIAAHQLHEHVLLLPSGQPGDPTPHLPSRGIDRLQRLARLGRRRQQFVVEAQELDDIS